MSNLKNEEVAPRLVAFRYRDFRLLWTGELVSMIGSQMQLFAINWHILELLRGQIYTLSIFGSTFELGADALGLGVIGLVRVVPIALFALIGGLLADNLNRRKLMIWTRAAAAVLAAILAYITITGQETVNAIYLLTALGAAATAFDTPAQQSVIPNLVPAKHLTNAISLNILQWQIGTIIGPALMSALIGGFGTGIVYAVTAGTFLFAIVMIWMMDYRGEVEGVRSGIGWQALKDGLQFTFNKKLIWSTMLLDFFATFFSSARTMLPIVVAEIFHLDVFWYGLMATAQPVGAMIAGIITSLRKDIYRQGLVLLVSVIIYGVATAIFGISTNYALSYVMFALTGAGDTVSTVIRGTIRQMMTPDHLRGRMVSVNMMFFMGGPQLGELEAGLVASAFGVPFAIFTGGVATVLLTLWIAWKYPRLIHYTSDSDPDSVNGTQPVTR